MPETPPLVLTIAGFDPSSGAGVTADIKTMAAHHCYGLACISALTVQTTQGVRRVEAVAPDLVQQTLEALASDTAISGVHVGMLGTEWVAEAVAQFLSTHKPPHVVVDPVLRSSSGAALLDTGGIRTLMQRLLPLAEVLTPNVEEAGVLTGMTVTNMEEAKAASLRLHSCGARAVVVTGGHLQPAADLLSYSGANGLQQMVFSSPRLESGSTHGTGCAFSTALTCRLAQGMELPEAVVWAKKFVTAAITHAYPMGRGTGPVNHLYEWDLK